MTHYELLYIVSGKIAEDDQKNITNQVESLIKKLEGNSTLSESLGKKKLAYPIKKNNNGFYYVNEFDLNKNQLKELEKNLKLINEIIRFLVITKKPVSQEEIKKSAKGGSAFGGKEAKKAEKKKHPVKSSSPVKKETKVKKTKKSKAKEETAKEKEEKKKKEKVSIEELDKKLDEILDKDITD